MFFFCLVMLVCLQFVCASLSLSYLLVASALGEWEWGVSGSICKQHILRKLRLSLRQTLLAGKTGNKLNQMKDLIKDMIVLLPSSF